MTKKSRSRVKFSEKMRPRGRGSDDDYPPDDGFESALFGFAVPQRASGGRLIPPVATEELIRGFTQVLEDVAGPLARPQELPAPLAKILGKKAPPDTDQQSRFDATHVIVVSKVVDIIRRSLGTLRELQDIMAGMTIIGADDPRLMQGHSLADRMITQVREKVLTQESERKTVTYKYAKREI